MPKVKPLTERQIYLARVSDNLTLIKGVETDEELREEMNTTAYTFREIKKNPLKMSIEQLILLCTAHGIAPADFLGKELKIS